MPEKYSISVLSGMEIPNLRRVLREYGVPERLLEGKRKMDLIEMVCNRQDPPRQKAPEKKPRVSIATEPAYRKAGLKRGDACYICFRESGVLVHERDVSFIDEVRDLKGKIIGLTFQINGYPRQIWWKDIEEAWKN